MQYKVQVNLSDHKRLKHLAIDEHLKVRQLQHRAAELLVTESERVGVEQLATSIPDAYQETTLVNWEVDPWTWAVIRELRHETQVTVAQLLRLAVELLEADLDADPVRSSPPVTIGAFAHQPGNETTETVGFVPPERALT